MEFVPPRKVFQSLPMDAQERTSLGGYDIPDFLHAGLSKTGGMLSYFKGHPHPRKGFIYSEGVMSVNKAKRITLALFQPLANIKDGLLGFAESYLKNYIRMIDAVFADCTRIPFLHYQYYSEFSKNVWDFTFLFLRKLGISFGTAHKVGLILATIFENDDAYKIRMQDILNESSKEALLNDLQKELKRLIVIFTERETTFEAGESGAGGRILKMAKFLLLLLRIPKIKKALVFALNNTNYEWFKYDDSDYYWALNRNDFKTLGREFEDRRDEQVEMMVEYAEKITGQRVRKVENPDGSIKIETY